MNHLGRICGVVRDDARDYSGAGLWLAFRCLPALVLGALVLLPLSASTARAAQVPVEPDAVRSGHLLLRSLEGDGFSPALMHRGRVHFDINGTLAVVRLEQVFRNDSDRYVEGVYAFPLPPDAAVRHLEMTIGQRRIVGTIRERAQAKEIYRAAKRAGKKASLVEQQRPNLFTNRVANIGPGEEVAVRLEYVQQVAYGAGVFSLRFPMTITPRFMPGAPLAQARGETGGEEGADTLVPDPYLGWARPTDAVPDANAVSPLLHPGAGSDHAPRNPIEITAELDMGMPLAAVAAPYHDIALSRRAGVYSLRLVEGVSEMDRDFVLTWEPVAASAPRAAFFTGRVGDEHYGLLLMVPPTRAGAVPPVPREIVFVIDTSGSMGGVSIEQARAALARALRELRPQDRFNIIAFDSTHRALYRAPVPATQHNVQRAREFVRLLQAGGGTMMLPALQAALKRAPEVEARADAAHLRQVVFITDGAVGNERALFEEIARELGDSRLFTVGIGSAPNSWFMREAARFGRGTHTHIGDVGEVDRKMTALFRQLSRPAAVDIAVHWPLAVEAFPARVPDLYHGQPLALAVSFGATPPAGEVEVRGTVAGRPWRSHLALSAAPEDGGHDGVASLWARRKIAGLLDGLMLGREEEAVRADVLPLALRHRLLSPYTSFVAVEEVISRPADEELASRPVPNTRPRGQSDQPFAYPRTATTGPARAWFAALALFLALLLHLLRREEVERAPRAATR